MTDPDRDDITSDSATGERNRRQKRTLPKPLFRLLLVLAALIIIVVVVVFAARSAVSGGEADDYQTYMGSLADILERSDDLGSDLEKLLTSPGETNRTQVQTRLEEIVTASKKLEEEAKLLEAPKDLVEQSVHQIFLLVMSFRHRGVADLKPSLMAALEVQETEVAAEQISHSLYYLVNSDFLYEEVFKPDAAAVLQKKELTGVTVPSSEFFSDPDLASEKAILRLNRDEARVPLAVEEGPRLSQRAIFAARRAIEHRVADDDIFLRDQISSTGWINNYLTAG